MNLEGLLVGAVAFFLIGLFHPLVLKGEYYFGRKICWVFLVAGLASLIASVFLHSTAYSAIAAVLGFTCLWSIKEVFEQEKRVERGWYPKNPKR
ncbi:DUF4491 family protein [Bengtsoniella intestinalis]|uniref:DUF4491 family protein n=1 Tax=Bengtsoniella intestinalis TaxID=3073143 RepID=UPI00391F096D